MAQPAPSKKAQQSSPSQDAKAEDGDCTSVQVELSLTEEADPAQILSLWDPVGSQDQARGGVQLLAARGFLDTAITESGRISLPIFLHENLDDEITENARFLQDLEDALPRTSTLKEVLALCDKKSSLYPELKALLSDFATLQDHFLRVHALDLFFNQKPPECARLMAMVCHPDESVRLTEIPLLRNDVKAEYTGDLQKMFMKELAAREDEILALARKKKNGICRDSSARFLRVCVEVEAPPPKGDKGLYSVQVQAVGAKRKHKLLLDRPCVAYIEMPTDSADSVVVKMKLIRRKKKLVDKVETVDAYECKLTLPSSNSKRSPIRWMCQASGVVNPKAKQPHHRMRVTYTAMWGVSLQQCRKLLESYITTCTNQFLKKSADEFLLFDVKSEKGLLGICQRDLLDSYCRRFCLPVECAYLQLVCTVLDGVRHTGRPLTCEQLEELLGVFKLCTANSAAFTCPGAKELVKNLKAVWCQLCEDALLGSLEAANPSDIPKLGDKGGQVKPLKYLGTALPRMMACSQLLADTLQEPAFVSAPFTRAVTAFFNALPARLTGKKKNGITFIAELWTHAEKVLRLLSDALDRSQKETFALVSCAARDSLCFLFDNFFKDIKVLPDREIKSADIDELKRCMRQCTTFMRSHFDIEIVLTMPERLVAVVSKTALPDAGDDYATANKSLLSQETYATPLASALVFRENAHKFYGVLKSIFKMSHDADNMTTAISFFCGKVASEWGIFADKVIIEGKAAIEEIKLLAMTSWKRSKHTSKENPLNTALIVKESGRPASKLAAVISIVDAAAALHEDLKEALTADWAKYAMGKQDRPEFQSLLELLGEMTADVDHKIQALINQFSRLFYPGWVHRFASLRSLHPESDLRGVAPSEMAEGLFWVLQSVGAGLALPTSKNKFPGLSMLMVGMTAQMEEAFVETFFSTGDPLLPRNKRCLEECLETFTSKLEGHLSKDRRFGKLSSRERSDMVAVCSGVLESVRLASAFLMSTTITKEHESEDLVEVLTLRLAAKKANDCERRCEQILIRYGKTRGKAAKFPEVLKVLKINNVDDVPEKNFFPNLH